MNDILPPFTAEPTVPATGEEFCLIAIAFTFPREHASTGVLGCDNPHLLLTMALGLQRMLEREQLVADDFGFSGDLCDGLIQFETRWRTAALQIVSEWRGRMPAAIFSSVGWKDGTVSTWRIVAHGAFQIQFEDFLAPERAQARKDIMERFQQTLTELRNFPIIPPEE